MYGDLRGHPRSLRGLPKQTFATSVRVRWSLSHRHVLSTVDAFEYVVCFVVVGLKPHQRDARVVGAFGVSHLLSLCTVHPPRFHEDRTRIRGYDMRRAAF